MHNNNKQDQSSYFLILLGLLFIGLKLMGQIDWSWWWVLSPLWGGLAIAAAGFMLLFVFYGLYALYVSIRKHLEK